MTSVLVYANDKEKSQLIREEFLAKAQENNLEIAEGSTVPDYIVSIGGDGTLLSAFHKFQPFINHAQFLGIHTGHLGFYADWLGHEVDQVIEGILYSPSNSIAYPLIEIIIDYEEGNKQEILALNEFAIRSKSGTVVLDVYLKDFKFETFRGDGVCISTPTGSTGLNKSLGGAVIHPRVEAMQMTEMASLNNIVYRTLSSPMIIPKDEWILLKPHHWDNHFLITIDNLIIEASKISSIRVALAKEKINFAAFRHTHFWDRVESSFIGRQAKDNQQGHHYEV